MLMGQKEFEGFDKDIYSNMLIEPNIIKTFRPTKI